MPDYKMEFNLEESYNPKLDTRRTHQMQFIVSLVEDEEAAAEE